jgi:hypothetical protein
MTRAYIASALLIFNLIAFGALALVIAIAL